ncbi:MAG: FAD:protein FMN transferase, partial [Lachnospiraceae bacterium]|nr:FAD:protein FMN transferase [Lachnospiraceae bacterium]
DFGGIAKGFTSDRIMDVYREAGVSSGLVSLGGNVQALGTKTDGSRWKIGIQNPEKDGTYLGIIEVEDRAVITSGGYERYFEEDGKTYHHILDASRGRPSDSGLKSVTIVSENGMLADALSTALFVMGADRAEKFYSEHGDAFEMVLLTEDGKLLVSEGLKGFFSTDLETEWVPG